jgi:hypothetical protein
MTGELRIDLVSYSPDQLTASDDAKDDLALVADPCELTLHVEDIFDSGGHVSNVVCSGAIAVK